MNVSEMRCTHFDVRTAGVQLSIPAQRIVEIMQQFVTRIAESVVALLDSSSWNITITRASHTSRAWA